MSEQRLEDAVEFLDQQPRCACVLLLDTSGSMSGSPINELNAGLQAFRDELVKDDLAKKRVEVAIVEFNSNIKLVQDFVTAEEFQPPTLSATGLTGMGAGIEKALDLIQERKQKYKDNGVTYYRPWIFLITDGAPTDSTQIAETRLKKSESDKGIVFFAVGVQGANMVFLQQIAGAAAKKLDGLNFKDLFLWLSTSMQRVSQSKPGDQTALPSTDPWAAIGS
jgi:uncharacterized protein YegL